LGFIWFANVIQILAAMINNSSFFSLRWKLAILFGVVFLVLQSLNSYLSYLNAKEKFNDEREQIQKIHISIAETLTSDAFLTLEQFAELISDINGDDNGTSINATETILTLDEHWSRWQLVWDIDLIAVFDQLGKRIKLWGQAIPNVDESVNRVLLDKFPEHRVFCSENCYQQATIPIMDKTGTASVVSIVRSFSDVIIKYRNSTGSDIGILVNNNSISNSSATDKVGKEWLYKLSAMTNPQQNQPIYGYIRSHYQLNDFLNHSRRIEFHGGIYEIYLTPIQPVDQHNLSPYFILIDDITSSSNLLNSNLKQIWISNLLFLMAALTLIYFLLHFPLRRLTKLSKALPLLSRNSFDHFKNQVLVQEHSSFGFDELDKLRDITIELAEQLESLENEMSGRTFNLMEKTRELAQERDFNRQVIELAPLTIITQKINGIILTVNNTGSEMFGLDSEELVGKVFDIYVPEDDREHSAKLIELRQNNNCGQFQVDGKLETETGRIREMSWLHKLLPSKDKESDKVILSIGLDISERKIAEERNIRMAYHDYLTGLGNRRKFHEEFTLKLASADRYGYQLALYYLDLDRFKEINDTSGHEAGDNFLRMCAETIKGVIRSTDLLCRLGGDEFTLIMPHVDHAGVEQIAVKINRILQEMVFISAGKQFAASASIGIAVFPLHGSSASELIANADMAMYRAKELGRNQYHIFDPSYDYRSKSSQIVYWRRLLEDAIANDKFILFYQPILNVKTNTVSHYECLIRLQAKDGSIIPPADFVYRAEELGLISKIDRIAVKKAVEKHLEFKRQGKFIKLSVNISRRSLEDSYIFGDIAKIFSDKEVDQKMIIFEITDNAAISNYHSTNALINRIKDLGCMLALNDFGVEYPSLQYLKSAPVDYVKIDGSLIKHIDKNADDKIFVRTLAEIAQAFGKKTVAEFVESEDILHILKEFGIDYAQGYHIGRPGALDEKNQ
jgi:diguanylate cyclase (GGDEF)-like protein/PAS domain S-box-containing protein